MTGEPVADELPDTDWDAEPGEDTCLACRHPDHDDEGCGARIATGLFGTDGVPVDGRCVCTGWTPPTGAAVAPDPWSGDCPWTPPF